MVKFSSCEVRKEYNIKIIMSVKNEEGAYHRAVLYKDKFGFFNYTFLFKLKDCIDHL